MHPEQAKAYNEDINEQIRVLQDKLVSKMRVRVVERLEGGRRETVESFDTDYIKQSDADVLYKDLRAKYTDSSRCFVIVEPLPDVKRSVQVRLPRRTDDEREPPTGIETPNTEDPFAQIA